MKPAPTNDRVAGPALLTTVGLKSVTPNGAKSARRVKACPKAAPSRPCEQDIVAASLRSRQEQARREVRQIRRRLIEGRTVRQGLVAEIEFRFRRDREIGGDRQVSDWVERPCGSKCPGPR